jgi:hypothetical protein
MVKGHSSVPFFRGFPGKFPGIFGQLKRIFIFYVVVNGKII